MARNNAQQQESMKQLANKYKTRQTDGANRADFVGYERITIIHNAVNKLALFTTSMQKDGIGITNFPSAGRVNDQESFLIEEIAIDIEPSGSPAAFGAQAVALRTNDVAYIESKGYLSIFTGTNRQTVLEGGPLRIFPGNNGVGGKIMVTDQSTVGANMQSRIDAPITIGKPFVLKRPIMLLPQEIYGGLLDMGNTALVMPSATNATLLLRYRGLRFTASGNR